MTLSFINKDLSSDPSSDLLNFKSSLIVFSIFLYFIAYLHSFKNINGLYFFIYIDNRI